MASHFYHLKITWLKSKNTWYPFNFLRQKPAPDRPRGVHHSADVPWPMEPQAGAQLLWPKDLFGEGGAAPWVFDSFWTKDDLFGLQNWPPKQVEKRGEWTKEYLAEEHKELLASTVQIGGCHDRNARKKDIEHRLSWYAQIPRGEVGSGQNSGGAKGERGAAWRVQWWIGWQEKWWKQDTISSMWGFQCIHLNQSRELKEKELKIWWDMMGYDSSHSDCRSILNRSE